MSQYESDSANKTKKAADGGVLFIGPQGCGGISAVMDAYRDMFPTCRFVSSYKGGTAFKKLIDFARGFLRTFTLLLKDRSIRIVHIHTASNSSFRRKKRFVRLAKALGRSVVMHIHGGGFKEYLETDPKCIVDVLNECDEIVCLTPEWREYFQSRGVGNLNVIPNPVGYPGEVIRTDHPAKIRFLFMGLLHRDKGLFDLVEAVSSLSSEDRDKIEVNIGGVGPEQENLRREIERRSLEKIVFLCGWVSGEDKTRLLKESHCFVLPSYVEGQPVSILEAMAWGMPIIATNVGGIPSIVEDGINGRLHQPGDIAGLAESIKEIINYPSLLLSYGRNSRIKAEDYSSDKVRKKLSKIYFRHGVIL